jgi:hypothetical protein
MAKTTPELTEWTAITLDETSEKAREDSKYGDSCPNCEGFAQIGIDACQGCCGR